MVFTQPINKLDEIRSILNVYLSFEVHSGLPKELIQDLKDINDLVDKLEDRLEDIELDDIFEDESPYNDNYTIKTIKIETIDDEMKFDILKEMMSSKTLSQIEYLNNLKY